MSERTRVGERGSADASAIARLASADADGGVPSVGTADA